MFDGKSVFLLFTGFFLLSGCVSGADNLPEVGVTVNGEGDNVSEDATEINSDAGRAPQRGSDEDLLALQDKLNEIVLSGELQRCEELYMEQFFTNCEVIILSGRANSAEDTGVCEAASNEAIKLRCESAVQAM